MDVSCGGERLVVEASDNNGSSGVRGVTTSDSVGSKRWGGGGQAEKGG